MCEYLVLQVLPVKHAPGIFRLRYAGHYLRQLPCKKQFTTARKDLSLKYPQVSLCVCVCYRTHAGPQDLETQSYPKHRVTFILSG